MREIVFDTETTGFDPENGHRLVEVGCVELIDRIPTGETFQRYINPDRDIPSDAFRVHGLSAEFLSRHPLFREIADAFLEFVGDARLVAHNAEFDMRFINWELNSAGKAILPGDRFIDTLAIARRKFPGQRASLDALCERMQIDNSNRTLHGALLDAEILAEVYVELTGGRQRALGFGDIRPDGPRQAERRFREPRPHAASEAEKAAHAAFIADLPNAIWSR